MLRNLICELAVGPELRSNPLLSPRITLTIYQSWYEPLTGRREGDNVPSKAKNRGIALASVLRRHLH